jgi:hypothetical protein
MPRWHPYGRAPHLSAPLSASGSTAPSYPRRHVARALQTPDTRPHLCWQTGLQDLQTELCTWRSSFQDSCSSAQSLLPTYELQRVASRCSHMSVHANQTESQHMCLQSRQTVQALKNSCAPLESRARFMLRDPDTAREMCLRSKISLQRQCDGAWEVRVGLEPAGTLTRNSRGSTAVRSLELGW